MMTEDSRSKSSPPVYTKDIPLRTVFYGRIPMPTSPRELMLAAYDRVVSLENPSNTWQAGHIEVWDYEPVAAKVVVFKTIKEPPR
jgi:hypothetical protein